jgi:hypothetical protein
LGASIIRSCSPSKGLIDSAELAQETRRKIQTDIAGRLEPSCDSEEQSAQREASNSHRALRRCPHCISSDIGDCLITPLSSENTTAHHRTESIVANPLTIIHDVFQVSPPKFGRQRLLTIAQTLRSSLEHKHKKIKLFINLQKRQDPAQTIHPSP